jgi:hypothetical protein
LNNYIAYLMGLLGVDSGFQLRNRLHLSGNLVKPFSPPEDRPALSYLPALADNPLILRNRMIRKKDGHTGPPLPRIVQWFKTMTTNEYIRDVKENGWMRFSGRLWQRNSKFCKYR